MRSVTEAVEAIQNKRRQLDVESMGIVCWKVAEAARYSAEAGRVRHQIGDLERGNQGHYGDGASTGHGRRDTPCP